MWQFGICLCDDQQFELHMRKIKQNSLQLRFTVSLVWSWPILFVRDSAV